jgi:hypothetical protein
MHSHGSPYQVIEPDTRSKEIQQRHLQVVITTPIAWMDVFPELDLKNSLKCCPTWAVWRSAQTPHTVYPSDQPNQVERFSHMLLL